MPDDPNVEGSVVASSTASDPSCPVGQHLERQISYGAYFGLLVAFYWGLQVWRNLSHTITAGAVGSWWFSPHDQGQGGGGVVSGSLRRACTWSFGSICFGSLLVAVVRALEQLARSSRNRDNDGAACLAQCILGCLESLLEWINKWAFVYVGLYGLPFAKAGRAAFQLFKSRGWTAIINDDLIENTLSFAALVTGGLTGALSYMVVKTSGSPWGHTFDGLGSDSHNEAALVAAVVGVIIGIAVSAVVMAVIEAAVCTVFVCFAQDPDALRHTRPEHHTDLLNAWSHFHPTVLVACGYVD